MARRETRHYPSACLSMYCGKIECPAGCPSLPALRRFKEWRDRTGATPSDPVWSPTIYVTPTPPEEG